MELEMKGVKKKKKKMALYTKNAQKWLIEKKM